MVTRVRLQERDREILEHIRRFRMTTPEVLHRLFFSENKLDAVTSTIRRLRKADYLASADLEPPRRCYYHLTSRAVRLMGLPASLGRSLGEQALPTRYAILLFCCTHDKERHLLRVDEFQQEFPDCQSKNIPKEPYYFDDDDGATRLAFIMVDLGADAGRIVRKCRKAIGERRKVTGFRSLIQDDAFQLTVLTGRQTKKQAIEAAKKRSEKFTGRLRVEVIEELTRVT